jgi:hypothetical protein
MRSEFCEWLDQMQHIADKENVIVQARSHASSTYLTNKIKYNHANRRNKQQSAKRIDPLW